MTLEEIIRMAHELGEAIAQSEVIDGIEAAQNRLMMDKDAYDLLMRYQDARMKLQHKIEDGMNIDPVEENHFDILEQQLKVNDVVKDLMEAQEKLDNLMQAVYFSINQALSGGSCGDSCGDSDCSSCGGGCGQ